MPPLPSSQAAASPPIPFPKLYQNCGHGWSTGPSPADSESGSSWAVRWLLGPAQEWTSEEPGSPGASENTICGLLCGTPQPLSHALAHWRFAPVLTVRVRTVLTSAPANRRLHSPAWRPPAEHAGQPSGWCGAADTRCARMRTGGGGRLRTAAAG